MSQERRETLVILDFGSQYSQLIARRVRELEVYCELIPYNTSPERVMRLNPVGYILSGGPASVYAPQAPHLPEFVLSDQKPILGICYGMQLLAHQLGGQVEPGAEREYGPAELEVVEPTSPLFGQLPDKSQSLAVWMSHGDRVTQLPEGFQTLARSHNSPQAAIGDPRRGLYGLQFHPEVTHTPQGRALLRAFLYDVCDCRGGWTPGNIIEESITHMRTQIGGGKVVCGLSGGVDSAVVAALLQRAIGDQLTCIFVNNGLLRQNEPEQVVQTFQKEMQTHLVAVEATEDFLSALAGVTDPEAKRKIIGEKFVRIFEVEARRLGQVDFLAQGTVYPDVIESAKTGHAGAVVIKHHHNVGGLPSDMEFELIEPLRNLFKDEVRQVGEALGLPHKLVWRHPFPGPGLAVRILGEVTWDRLETLRMADAIFLQELEIAGWYDKAAQAFAVLLPEARSTGVAGDMSKFGQMIVLRAVTTDDFMTASPALLPYEILSIVSTRIFNELTDITRVVYDLSTKPPATIEWL